MSRPSLKPVSIHSNWSTMHLFFHCNWLIQQLSKFNTVVQCMALTVQLLDRWCITKLDGTPSQSQECFHLAEKQTASLSKCEYFPSLYWGVAYYGLLLIGWNHAHIVIKASVRGASEWAEFLQVFSDSSHKATIHNCFHLRANAMIWCHQRCN